MALNKEEVGEVDESAEDRLRDMRQERGGVDGNTNYRKPVKFASHLVLLRKSMTVCPHLIE